MFRSSKGVTRAEVVAGLVLVLLGLYVGLGVA